MRAVTIVRNSKTKKTCIKFDTNGRYIVVRLRNEIRNLRSYPVKCIWIILLRCRRKCRRCRCYKIGQKQHSPILTDILPGVVPLGLNGAAIAAFGDNPLDFGDVIWPLEVRAAGVKLGESTLNRCFTLSEISGYMVSVYFLRWGFILLSLLILCIPFGLQSKGFHRFMIECTTFEFMLAFHGLRSSAIQRNLSLHIDSGHISSHSCRGYLLSVLCSAISLTFLI